MMSEGRSQNPTCHRRLPPFGRALDTVLKAGRKPANCVFCFLGTEAWDVAKAHSRHQAVLFLPRGELPSHYRGPVTGVDCLLARIGDTTKREILLLTRELLIAGAVRVVIILVEDLFGRSPITAGNVRDEN